MTLRRIVFDDYRNVSFLSLTLVTSTFALRPESSIIPTISLLSVLLLYSPFLFRSHDPQGWINIVATLMALSIGGATSRIHASLEALSSPGQSLTTLFLISTFLSSLSLGALYCGTKLNTRLSSPRSQITLFPAIWSSIWCTVSYLSPVGHLSTWSITDNTDAYSWLIPFLGPASKNWIIAAWAVIISQTLGDWYIGPQEEDLIATSPGAKGAYQDGSSFRKFLAAFLLALSLPSFYLPHLPLPISTIDVASPLTVACVVPPYQRYKHHSPTIDDYIEESKKVRSAARVILWPEGAIVFNSTAQKEQAFSEIRKQIDGPYVGVSFEETISDPSDPTGRHALTRTGIAVISRYSPEPYLQYYKRNLVPFAESYRLRADRSPPEIFELPLARPGNYIPKTEWSSDPDHTRPIPITASICLDFATPSPFAALESRPALILAPARTWDRTVGYAMWLQAKQRAEELGSMVLWCDGGDGGVSGIAGHGFNDVAQVGSGTFIRTIGIPYPFETTSTPFARFGDSVLILFWLLLVPGNLLRGGRRFRISSFEPLLWFHAIRRPEAPVQSQPQPNLVDL
ncbi:hypothetical protein NLJ89_g2405 [Agrocybe chaxingu]|uniref:Apolipoprotein N-acyltransferase n=1 Tax=Agrocybe chaxingu TaxID=84603 RepID=A0A9W8MYQ7_9AGAR|nr:hypothetical protein NLJ89_g2405 [Agrocybe chaxingu]